MREVNLIKAKEIVCDDSYDAIFRKHRRLNPTDESRALQLLRFTRLVMESEIETVKEVEDVCSRSHDLIHLSGVHEFREDAHGRRIDELRHFWGVHWETLRHVKHVQQFIETVCENAGGEKKKRSVGLFYRHRRAPWRTPEWFAERKWREIELKQLNKLQTQPLTKFYPYITDVPTEEHYLLLQVDALVPKGLKPDMRADICQEMLVDIYCGNKTIADLRESINFYVKQFFKQNHIWRSVSIDAPVFGNTGKQTLAEVLSSPNYFNISLHY